MAPISFQVHEGLGSLPVKLGHSYPRVLANNVQGGDVTHTPKAKGLNRQSWAAPKSSGPCPSEPRLCVEEHPVKKLGLGNE